jgi:multidrug efflux pump subunit AcrA (membrane-fusion protein)
LATIRTSPGPRVAPDLSGLKIDETARKRGGGRLLWIAVVIVVLAAAGLGIYATREKAPAVEVASVAPLRSGPAALLNASGYVTPRRRATVAAKITARVTNVYADEGLRVREGQVLATLDDSDYRVRLTQAQADRDATAASLKDLEVNLANAEREQHRLQQLKAGGVTSQEALDNANTTVESLRARIAQTRQQVGAADARIRVAQQDLENCTVRAPFAGIVV